MRRERLAWVAAYLGAFVIHLALLALITQAREEPVAGGGLPQGVFGISETQLFEAVGDAQGSASVVEAGEPDDPLEEAETAETLELARAEEPSDLADPEPVETLRPETAPATEAVAALEPAPQDLPFDDRAEPVDTVEPDVAPDEAASEETEAVPAADEAPTEPAEATASSEVADGAPEAESDPAQEIEIARAEEPEAEPATAPDAPSEAAAVVPVEDEAPAESAETAATSAIADRVPEAESDPVREPDAAPAEEPPAEQAAQSEAGQVEPRPSDPAGVVDAADARQVESSADAPDLSPAVAETLMPDPIEPLAAEATGEVAPDMLQSEPAAPAGPSPEVEVAAVEPMSAERLEAVEEEAAFVPRPRPAEVPEAFLRRLEQERQAAEAARIAERQAVERRVAERRAAERRVAERAAAERRKARQRAAAAEQGEAQPAARPRRAQASGGAAASGASQRQEQGPGRATASSYRSRVYAHLQRHKRFPAGARSGGTVTVTFTIGAGGAAGGIRLTRSSGDGTLDKAALDMVRRASPFPPIPPEIGRSALTFTVPVDFSLRR